MEDAPVLGFRLLPPQETAKCLGVSRRTLERMVDAGEFVRPIRVSRNRLGFVEGAVKSWIASKMEAA